MCPLLSQSFRNPSRRKVSKHSTHYESLIQSFICSHGNQDKLFQFKHLFAIVFILYIHNSVARIMSKHKEPSALAQSIYTIKICACNYVTSKTTGCNVMKLGIQVAGRGA